MKSSGTLNLRLIAILLLSLIWQGSGFTDTPATIGSVTAPSKPKPTTAKKAATRTKSKATRRIGRTKRHSGNISTRRSGRRRSGTGRHRGKTTATGKKTPPSRQHDTGHTPQSKSTAKPIPAPWLAPATKYTPTKLAASPSHILTVAQSGGGNFKTIGEALAQAKVNARIVVRPGRYRESLVLERPVEIIGSGLRGQVIIENTNTPCIVMRATAGVVRGVTIRGLVSGSNNEFHAVDVSAGRLALEDCEVFSQSRVGIGVYGASTRPLIRRSNIHGAVTSGIFFYDNSEGVVEDCRIYGNGAGIEIRQSANPIIRRCKIYAGTATGPATGKSITGNWNGIVVADRGRGIVEGCWIAHNLFSGVQVKRDGNPTIRGCRITANRSFGISMERGSAATVEQCDLRVERGVAWHLEEDVQVKRHGNKS